MIDIEQIRNNTLGCGSLIHLNNAGAALVPHDVAAAVQEYLVDEELHGGYEIADRRSAEVDEFYQLASQLLGCKPDNIAFTTSATDSYNKALSSIPFNPGDVVLLSKNDYPSHFITFLSLVKRYHIQVVLVENTAEGEIDLIDLEQKLQQYQPKLLSVSHVPTSSGLVQPVEQIGTIVSGFDTFFLLDACQSLGQLDVKAETTKADFISGTFRKFLRGPRGAGMLYVSQKVIDLGMEPLFPDLRGGQWQSQDSYVQVAGAKRFESWERSYALMMGSKEAIRYLLRIGISAIAERNKELVSHLKNGLAKINAVKLQDRGNRQCSIVTFSVTGSDHQKIKQFLAEKGINVYVTQKSSAVIDFTEKEIESVVRVSPHYYNTIEEIYRFLEVMAEFI